MLNLLFIANETTNFVFNQGFHHIENELAKKTNLFIWRKSGHIQDILRQTPFKPDFILIQNDKGAKFEPIIDGLSEINIPTGLFVEDVHRFVGKRREYIVENNIRNIFSLYKEGFLKIYPQFKDRFYWFPHHINHEIFKDYGLRKDINLLLMGAVNHNYPLRQKIYNHYKNNPEFVYHSHPGYKKQTNEKLSKLFINEKYAQEINRAKIFFTCGATKNYPLMKYFEVLGCRTLLLAKQFKDLDDLGLIPGVHYVDIDEHNFHQKAEYYLKNMEESDLITNQGYQFVHTYHTTKIRVEQLIARIEEIISNNS